MPNLQEFVNHMSMAVSLGRPPILCSRVEIAVDAKGERPAVMVLLRTQPELSELFFRVATFCYPLALLGNTALIYRHALPYIQAGLVAPSTTELIWAVEVGVPEGDFHGTSLDSEDGLFRVPQIQGAYTIEGLRREAAWAHALREAPVLKEQHELHPDAIEFLIGHLPDGSFAWTQGQRYLLGLINLGWNYANSLGSEVALQLTDSMLAAAADATVAARYA